MIEAFDPRDLAGNYVFNSMVEHRIAHILSEVSGLEAHDFCMDSPRPEYDFKLDQLPVELKITNSVYLPVEVSKDVEGTIPSGLAVSTAPYILYLSHGHGPRSPAGDPGKACVKVRMIERKWLLRNAKKYEPTVYQSGSVTEHAVVHYIRQDYLVNDLWLGDMNFKQSETDQRWLMDTTTFTPSRQCGGILRSLNEAFIAGDI